jgi:hypothetical protein
MFGYFLHEKSPVLFLTKMDWATFWAILAALLSSAFLDTNKKNFRVMAAWKT